MLGFIPAWTRYSTILPPRIITISYLSTVDELWRQLTIRIVLYLSRPHCIAPLYDICLLVQGYAFQMEIVVRARSLGYSISEASFLLCCKG